MKDVEGAIARLYGPARTASGNAYSPYSGVRVGACVVDESGKVYAGCNVENSSYGLTQCAERNALAAAIAEGMQPGTAHTLLIYATGFETLAPCGACRQVLYEKETQGEDPMELILYGSKKIQVFSKLTDLLPLPFKLAHLT